MMLKDKKPKAVIQGAVIKFERYRTEANLQGYKLFQRLIVGAQKFFEKFVGAMKPEKVLRILS